MEPNKQPHENPEPLAPVSSAETPAALRTKKKNLLWLWVTAGIVLLVLIALVTSYFIVKNAGNAVAKTYTANSQVYLDKIYDAATGAATDPGKIKKEIDAVKAPVLESTLLSDLSSDYVAAEKLQIEITKRVDTLSKTIDDNALVYSFYADYKDFYSELNTLDVKGVIAIDRKSKSGLLAYISEFNDKLKETKTFIDDASLPDELNAEHKELSRVFGAMSTTWNASYSALKNNNTSGYTAAYQNYKAANGEVTTVSTPFFEYFKDLSSKTSDAAGVLQSYRNTLK